MTGSINGCVKDRFTNEMGHIKRNAYEGAREGAIMGVLCSTLFGRVIATSIPHRIKPSSELALGTVVLFGGGVTLFAITGIFLSVIVGILKR